MHKIALITGATRNLGLSLAEGLARRLEPTDTVYLTGRDPARVAESVHRLSNVKAEVRGELLAMLPRATVEPVREEPAMGAARLAMRLAWGGS